MLRILMIAGASWWLVTSANASAACMSKTIEGDVATEVPQPGFERAAPRSKMTIVVAESDATNLAQSGFVVEACPATDKEKLKLASNMCATAAFGNEAVQARFTSVLGAPPKELCEAAKRAVGSAAIVAADALQEPAQQ